MPDPFHDPGAEQRALEESLDLFDSYREGVWAANDSAWPVKFVCCGESGRIVCCVPEEALDAPEHVLYIPEEQADTLQLLLTPDRCAESAATDHYLAYHGRAEGVHHPAWAACWVDAARHGPWVFDGDAFMTPNPAREAEATLCRRLNADKAALAALCLRFGGLIVPQPTCVGVIASGLHVRARFGVVRVPFARRVASPEEAAREVDRMLAAAPG